MNQLDTPILLIAFNRPKETLAVIDAIRKVQPRKLFVAIDAARNGNAYDQGAVQEVKNIIDTKIDWQCEVKKLYQEKNLGGGYGPAAGITWFFQNVEAGIVLEDDCVATESFFRFCQELLQKYIDEEKIMHISGNNYQKGIQRGPYSYYFSKYTHNWGWATWKRAWQHFDHTLIPERERSHVWDMAWEKSVRKNGGFGIIPQVNMVNNIGFGEHATHTSQVSDVDFGAAGTMTFPLNHPSKITWNIAADYYTYTKHFNRSLLKSLFARIKKYL